MATAAATTAAVERLDVSVYTIPTDAPESDGTLRWEETTIVVVQASAGGEVGLGYTYGDGAVGALVESVLADVVAGRDALAVGEAWAAMRDALRNVGYPGVGAMAVSAVDAALWDLKARLLGLPLAVALDAVRAEAPVYGSGGLTSYSDERLAAQLAEWVEAGIPRVKMKVGRDHGRDPERVRAARAAIGEDAALFVDANGAYTRKQALAAAERFAEQAVTWLEEPVSSDDLGGLRLVRDRAPAGMEVAAGEYASTPGDLRRLLEAGAVDCLQADATRCGGITGFLRAGALADAFGLDLSGHTAPALHLHAACAVPRLRHLEWFHTHVRIERMLFDGVVEPRGGVLSPDLSRRGHGLELRRADAERYAA